MATRRYLALMAICQLANMCTSAPTSKLDLPMATHGFDAWTNVVAKAVSFGGRSQDHSLEALKDFQAKVMVDFKKQADILQEASKGDFTDLLVKLVSPNIQISKPVFFSNSASPQSVLTDTIAAVQFSYTGVGVAPCAVPITPLGVGIFPQGVNIQPEGVNVNPEGVNVQPQGVAIAPNLIVIGPYDTTVAGQGLNIAPALITVAPVKTVVNPVGPLSVSDTLISVTVPAAGGK